MIQYLELMVFAARRGGSPWLEITMRFSARRHERQRLLTKSDKISTTFPSGKSTSALRRCGPKSHGSRRREAPNKHLSAPPPLFLRPTTLASPIEPSLSLFDDDE